MYYKIIIAILINIWFEFINNLYSYILKIKWQIMKKWVWNLTQHRNLKVPLSLMEDMVKKKNKN